MNAARVVRSEAAEQQKKIIAGAAFALIAGLVLYFELGDPSPKSRTPNAANVVPTVNTGPSQASASSQVSATGAIQSGALATMPPGSSTGAATRVSNTAAALDPTLRPQGMLLAESVVYTGSGRNIFAGPGEAAPVAVRALPKPIGTARPQTQLPVPKQPSGPATPAPIDLKFFGTATTTTNGHRRAFLLHGDDVFLASDGDIVLRKYRVISVGASSIQVEDLTDNNRQTLPLVTR